MAETHRDAERARAAAPARPGAVDGGRSGPGPAAVVGAPGHRPARRPPSPVSVVALQRTAGNAAVGSLLAPVPATTVARRSGPGRRAAPVPVVQRRPPDVRHEGHHSFYLRGMIPMERGEVRVQFHQDAADPASATFAVWYQETGTLERVAFTPAGAISPDLVHEGPGTATFDLDGDGRADVHLVAQPDDATRGLHFTAALPGGQLFRMRAVPSGSLPRHGIPFGQLPDGRTYYLVPGTTHLPGGPRFVDDRNMGVNPALEAQGAGVVRAAGQGYLIGYAVILAVALTAVALEAVAVAEVTGGAGAGTGAAMTSGQLGRIIGWGTGQTAADVAATEAVTRGLTTQAIRQMIARGLTRRWVEAQLALYEAAVARGGAKLVNQQLLPRLALMRRLLELWP